MAESFEIHLSRRAASFFLLSAAILLWFGTEILFLHRIFSPEDLTDHPSLLSVVVILFFGVIPLLVIARQIPYLLHPPLMLRVDAETVTFGTGWGYTPTHMPTNALQDVHASIATPSMSSFRPEQLLSLGGVVLEFDTTKDLPTGLATSAGIQFAFGRLVISRLYGNKSVKKSVAAIRPFCHKPNESTNKNADQLAPTQSATQSAKNSVSKPTEEN
ncbi:hypothetical protein COV06_00615 [Candidatus Uhrbacteria bacterium CG10_big_fil_rev_8_21_14_0_10_50_16]|uniref:Uncharacterized protein n=1 Tax=Candidatus Uhrbacteria bacterium CG10_big_fil_rev_8_21_14_0_10_50_16 TaxID=1975039 RepID=A0A2H0RMV8_9BACT|nr:MAG: hypothetical protein COV06_00615 [Candidatus Uhrbacteria bacterium CG10_big_fil_rev_8_21_14_0_10_50_16]